MVNKNKTSKLEMVRLRYECPFVTFGFSDFHYSQVLELPSSWNDWLQEFLRPTKISKTDTDI